MELHRITLASPYEGDAGCKFTRVLVLSRNSYQAMVAVARQAHGSDYVIHDGVVDPDVVVEVRTQFGSLHIPAGTLTAAQLLSLAPTARPTKTPEQVVAELEAVARQKWPESRDYQFRHGYVSGRIDALDATTATPAAREATVDPAQAVAQGLDELERRHGHEAFVKAFNDRIGAWCAAALRPVIAFISEPTAAQFDAAMAPFSVSAPKLTYGEPWRVSESELDPQMMWGPSSFVFNAGQNANATRKVMERIVACVNACAGLQLLPSGGFLHRQLHDESVLKATQDQREALRAERDTLRGALSEAEDYLKRIRAEELDGSEPELGQLLGRLTQVFINTGAAL